MTKEATGRIKINKLLEAAGWRFFADRDNAANIRLELSVKTKSTDLDALGEVSSTSCSSMQRAFRCSSSKPWPRPRTRWLAKSRPASTPARKTAASSSSPTATLLDGVKDGYLINPTVVDARTEVTTELLYKEGLVVSFTDSTGEEQQQTHWNLLTLQVSIWEGELHICAEKIEELMETVPLLSNSLPLGSTLKSSLVAPATLAWHHHPPETPCSRSSPSSSPCCWS